MRSAPPATGELVVQVALPVPVHGTFDYRVPARHAAAAEPGRRVRVPFGARRMVGVILARGPAGGDAPRALRAIDRVLDPEPVLTEELLRVVVAEAEAVFCPVGIALAAATPPGSSPREAVRVEPTPRGREALARGGLTAAARAVLERVARRPAELRALTRALGRGGAARLRALERDGLVRRVRAEAGALARTPRERWIVVPDPARAREALGADLARAPRQAEVLRRLIGEAPLPWARVAADDPRAPAALRALVARGLAAVEERDRETAALDVPPDTPPPLTPEQRRALDPIVAAVASREPRRFLLHGVTGSGKTEVYLRAVEATLAAGRQALVLVPEITLTHQIVRRLRARFGDRVAVLHSGLRPGERLAAWRRLRAGDTPIAVGARSALFAPLARLGLVVIDEEHDPAYKNHEGFRYHARELGARRAHAAGAPLVLGTATPSLETRHAAERGEIERLVLPHRIGGRPLPAVEIVDLAAERALLPRGRKLVLSRALRRALGDTLAEGGQAILFLNRRGFSTRIFCFECGHAERCKHCDISLVFHAREERLRCHYCDFSIPPPELCSGCGAGPAALLGLGTERLEEEVRILFPDARIARLDRDTAARRGTVERVLGALTAGEVDVLVGTQMVALGHDFPGVRLVGIVAADLGLHLPDFRAAERTFQLLTQAAGRAGRGHSPGRVIVQTFVPDHYAIRPVRDHDYEAFYREELRHRAALGYPPFGRLVHVLVSSPDAAEAEAVAAALAERARTEAAGAPAPGVEVLGPAPAPLARLRDRYRVQLLVKGTDEARVLRVGRGLAEEASRRRGDTRVVVDPLPANML